MPAYCFHCTDGFSLVLDDRGCELEDTAHVPRRAAVVAERLMRQFGRHLDWSDWVVAVHDGFGEQVSVISFDKAISRPSSERRRALRSGSQPSVAA